MNVELTRVLAVPRAPKGAARGATVETRYARKSCGVALFPAQRTMIAALEESASWERGPYGLYGAVLAAGCGHGKTLASLLAPSVYGASRPVLLVPASRVSATEVAYREWAPHYRLGPLPQILGYEGLSRPEGVRTLEQLRPDLIVCDEAHYLSNPESARWRRLARYLASERDCRLVLLSGTMLRASLLQIGHLWAAALKDRSPLPVGSLLSYWSVAADPGGEPTPDLLALLAPIATWAGQPATREGLRAAIGARVYDAPGIAHCTGASADVSLTLRALNISPAMPTTVHTATRALETRWELPDGEPLVSALDYDRAACTVPLGFWHATIPPVSGAWLNARGAWNRVVRAVLREGRADSPATARDYVRSQGGVRARVLEAWEEVEEDLAPQRETRWVSSEAADALVNAVQAAMDTDTSAPWVVWYRSRIVGALLSSRLHLPLHGMGSAEPTPGRHCVVSAAVHGTGWNGQAFHRSIHVEPYYTATQWQQILARQHRPGQTNDVRAVLLVSGPLGRAQIARSEAIARYVQTATREAQRLLYADRDGAGWRLGEGSG